MDIIWKRRSIRLFKPDPIPDEVIRPILAAGLQAPSPKNRQHWKLIAVTGKSKEIMLSLMAEGIDRSERGESVLSGSPAVIKNARFTMKCMARAPVTVFVMNPEGKSIYDPWTPADKIHEISDVQAIGAVAENMALEAASRGVGSLWNGNVFFAHDELCRWLDAGEMVLAMSFGWPAHHPSPLPRKKEEDVLEWRK